MRAQADDEVASGKAVWRRISDLPPGSILSPRFPVDEGWKRKLEVWIRKVRAIDDLTASYINECAAACERMRLDSLETLLGLARAMASKSVRLAKEDFVGAFKTLPLHPARTLPAVCTTPCGICVPRVGRTT